MIRWLWAALSVWVALSVCTTLFLCAYCDNMTVIVINGVLSGWIIYGAFHGRRYTGPTWTPPPPPIPQREMTYDESVAWHDAYDAAHKKPGAASEKRTS